MDTIKSSAEISYLFSHAARIHTPYLTLLLLPCQHGPSHSDSGRVAFIAGKKLGGAVWRNAAKRRMREICRAVGGPWPGYEVIFLAKARVVSAPYQTVLSACAAALEHSDIAKKAACEE